MRMLQRWSGLIHRQTLSTLVCHLIAFLLLTQRGGQCEMIGSLEPIMVMIGEDVILPCHVKPSTNVFSLTLEWARLDLSPRFVHVRRDGVELLLNQNPAYLGRTSLSTEKMQHGDLSLKLSKVKASDEGMYRCLIPGMGSSEVVLLVGAVSPPVVLMGDISSSGLDLQCESSGWYPEPEVLWLDGEGNLLSAESAETVKGRDDLYSVSSRVTMERRNNINIACRVQQRKINQTRETNVQILDVYSAPSCAPFVGVIIAVALLMLCVVFFVLWRMRRRRVDKNPSDEERKKEEEIPFKEMIRKEKEEEDKGDGEMLMTEDEKEKKTISEVILFLEEQSQKLKKKGDEQKLKLKGVEKDLEENERKCEKTNKKVLLKSGKLVSLEQSKSKLDKQKKELNSSLENTEKTLQRTVNLISKLKRINETDDSKPDKKTEIQQDKVE